MATKRRASRRPRRSPDGMTLYHGTLSDNLDSIYKRGIDVGEGWGGSGTSGVFLAADPKTALYWGQVAAVREYNDSEDNEESLGYDEYDRLPRSMKKAVVVEVHVPKGEVHRLLPDMEQAEDFGLEDPSTQESLEIMRSAVFPERIPASWLGMRPNRRTSRLRR